jgi:hypothetical protein
MFLQGLLHLYKHIHYHYYLRATAATPSTAASKVSAPGSAPRNDDVPEKLPWLVAPCMSSIPVCPYEVASMDGSMETVLPCRVYAVVGNVKVELGVTARSALLVRKTSAKPGAGTGIEHVLALWLHSIVVTFSVPLRRPSDSRLFPSVCRKHTVASSVIQRKKRDNGQKRKWDSLTCPAQVKLPLDDTESARRYLQNGGCWEKISLRDYVGKNLLDLDLRGRRVALTRRTAANRNHGSVC